MTLDEALDHIEYVRALDVPADAVLAVRSSRRLTSSQAQTIMADVERALPGRKVLVLSPDFEIVVVRDEATV